MVACQVLQNWVSAADAKWALGLVGQFQVGGNEGSLGIGDTHPKSGEPMMGRAPLDVSWACPLQQD